MGSTKARIVDFCRHYFGGIYHRVGDDHLLLLGSGLAFSVIMCIVPFVLIIIYLLGHFLESASVSHQLSLFIDTMIPYQQYADYAKKILYSRTDEVIAYKNIAGYIGALGLLLSASGLFSSMRTGLNVVFRTPGPSRVYLGKLHDLGMVLLVIIFIVLSTTLFPALEAVKDSAGKVGFLKFLDISGWQRAMFSIGSFISVFLLFFALYNLIPYKKPGLRVPAVGAAWAALFWVVAKEIFGYYITNVASIKRIYGTYVLFAVIIIWIYYSSVIFLFGGLIAQLYRERKAQKSYTILAEESAE